MGQYTIIYRIFDNSLLSLDIKVQAVFFICMIFKLLLIINGKVINYRKKYQVNTGNYHKNATQARHDYTVENLVYVDKNGIY